MKRAHFLILTTAVAVGCADAPTAFSGTSVGAYPPPAPAPSTAALSGRITVRGIGADRIVELRDDHDDVTRLLGTEAVALANVDGGDVVVWGTWDANPGFVVSAFKVTTMHGRPALDGVLEATDEGFAIRLNDVSFQVVAGLTSECVAYLGARIWVVGFDDGIEVQFGVIAGAQS
jgi:hypothetical protein